MVLKRSFYFLLILSTSLLIACQSNSSKRDLSRQIEVIPAKSPRPSIQVQEESPENQNTKQAAETDTQSQTRQSTGEDIVSTLLHKARKAISLKQWLRAQKALDQALRLDPHNATTFLLYGDIYIEIGTPDLAKNMYQRALFLSHKGSDTKKQAKANLNQK